MTNHKQERAQRIVDATMDLTLRPQQGDRAKVIASALRKLNDIFDEEGYGGDEPCCCVFRDIVDIIDELETLDELAQENPQGPLDAL